MLSWWFALSLDPLSWIKTIAQITLSVGGLATVGGGLLMYYTGNRISAIQNDTQVGIARDLVSTQTNLEATRGELREAHSELALLKAQQQPRKLSPSQREQFLLMTRELPKGSIQSFTAPPGDAEAQQFAKQVRQLLIDAGYPTGQIHNEIIAGDETGIIFSVTSIEAAPPYTGSLQRAFERIGYKAPAQLLAGQPQQTLYISIRQKPIPATE